MHFEILVEDKSGKKLLEAIVPKICPEATFRIINYKGIGKIPLYHKNSPPPDRKYILAQLPRLLKGYGKTYPEGVGDTSVVIIIDCDTNDCKKLISDMKDLLNACSPQPRALFRIAIEECEAWILGDKTAIKKAYPHAKKKPLETYTQDSICGTWEVLADAVYPGGSTMLSKKRYNEIGKAKYEWAERISPFIDVETNQSYSFQKLRNGLRRLANKIPTDIQ
jgi:hypothetical protein